MEDLSCNVADVALVLEGGGMRAAHTAGVVAALIEHEAWFPYVCGVSAGSSNAVNFLSRDPLRTRRSFGQAQRLLQRRLPLRARHPGRHAAV